MEIKNVILLSSFLFFLLPFTSAAHFIVGSVNDALDGTSANGYEVVIWNPSNGINDNLTDIIGPSGNSATDNLYFLDCELLSTPCVVGDELRARVLNNGSDYISTFANVSITGAGFDVMPNITLNSPPNVSLTTPLDFANASGSTSFSCAASDLDSNLANMTIYGNWSGGWHANQTNSLTGGDDSATFNQTLSEGLYQWSCLASDNLSVTAWPVANYTITIDNTAPVISAAELNESYMCGTADTLRVNCTVTDALSGISSVTIQATSPSSSQNNSATLLAGDTYYSDIIIDEEGQWSFLCIANDSAGNSQTYNSSNITTHPSGVELTISSEDINFSNSSPYENENITIDATISNDGCTDSGIFLTGFYEEDPDVSGIQIDQNQTTSVLARSNSTINVSWLANIGPTNIFVIADVALAVAESNESNNKANKSLVVPGWQDFFGNVSSTIFISDSDSNNFDTWTNSTLSSGGNIFLADLESIIDWDSLQAIGRDINNVSTSNDFSDIDAILGMQSFNDSVSDTFTSDGNTPFQTATFIINQRVVNFIPTINATASSNFITGALWDTSDDGDGEFSQSDAEDLVFITNINRSSPGSYGSYDYEIRVPAKLREQNTGDVLQMYMYFELN